MTRFKKKEMLEILSQFLKINEGVSKSNDIEAKAEALTVCQEQAISLGTYLESLGEMTESAVHALEDYCENIYQMCTAIEDANTCRKISKKIVKQITDLSNFIRYQLPDDKKEIVFLPYKAAMWDSLESVWMAAKEDENCEAYVIPIPYFDKNPDGTFRQMHYEGAEYPDYVPIIPWESFDFAEHKPDVAYIHNPYDDCNRVTCIHPHFFVKELKKTVDKVVYIPYFVAPSDTVEPHFCVLPGTLYSDEVVVQSEKVRQTYIEELHKFEKENNCVGAFGNIEEKIVALGSPKYDKVLGAAAQEIIIPEEWKTVIYKADGTKKKIVLYNTSVQNFLTYEDKMLLKIEDSLKIFEESQKEIALLWRPHPLIPATLQAMKPEMWDRYCAIVQKYKADGWGIFDESSDMDRAVIVSDAYYGDGGSVYELYLKTQKPIMLQNIELINE